MGVVVRKSKRVMVGTAGKQFYDVIWNGTFIDSVPRGEVATVKKRIKSEELRNKRMTDKKWKM